MKKAELLRIINEIVKFVIEMGGIIVMKIQMVSIILINGDMVHIT